MTSQSILEGAGWVDKIRASQIKKEKDMYMTILFALQTKNQK